MSVVVVISSQAMMNYTAIWEDDYMWPLSYIQLIKKAADGETQAIIAPKAYNYLVQKGMEKETYFKWICLLQAGRTLSY